MPTPTSPPRPARSGPLGASWGELARIVAGPVLGLVVWWLLGPSVSGTGAAPDPGGGAGPIPLTEDARFAALVATWMAAWWILEALPLPATALLPLVLLPVLGIQPVGETASAYGDDLIFLFGGGFVIGLAMERWGLHRRIALSMISVVGGTPKLLIGGFMLATAVLSAFISNTATTVMLLPVGLGIIAVVQSGGEDGERGLSAAPAGRFSRGMLLGIAYAASIGGTATIIGTPPNGIMVAIMSENLSREITYAGWLPFGGLFAGVFLVVVWFLLTSVMFRVTEVPGTLGHGVVREHLRRLGRITRPEVLVGIVFLLTAGGWVLRSSIVGWFDPDGDGPLPSRVALLEDATIAIAGALLVFLLPSGRRGERLIDWDTAVRLPWSVLLLFGGGLALAGSFASTGLDRWIGSQLGVLGGLPPIVLVLAVCLLLTFLTEVTSNTATASALLPVLASATGLPAHPEVLVVAAALSCSCAFMLPVATPPNAIVFGSGRLRMRDMMLAGVGLNVLGAVWIAIMATWVAPSLLGPGE